MQFASAHVSDIKERKQTNKPYLHQQFEIYVEGRSIFQEASISQK